MMVWYLVPSQDPERLVAVGWEPVLDPDRLTVAWFGTRQGELGTAQDLQEAIGEYAVLGSDVRAALEADRTGRADQALSPAALGPRPLELVVSQGAHRVAEERSPDPSTGRALLELALMVGLLVVVLILALVAVLGGAVDL